MLHSPIDLFVAFETDLKQIGNLKAFADKGLKVAHIMFLFLRAVKVLEKRKMMVTSIFSISAMFLTGCFHRVVEIQNYMALSIGFVSKNSRKC